MLRRRHCAGEADRVKRERMPEAAAGIEADRLKLENEAPSGCESADRRGWK
jgi:hypothetical protein